VRDHDVAADLTQMAFVRLVENAGRLAEMVAPRSWLLTVGANLARNHLRDTAKLVVGGDVDGAAEIDVHARLEAAERSRLLGLAIASLPRRQREAMRLRIYGELSFREIAEALGCSENTAKVSFHVGVKRLQRRLRGSEQ
jgi:RNA polymerase sigma-70 factor (ECF subfamily)